LHRSLTPNSEAPAVGRGFTRSLDDGLWYSLTSFALLTARQAALPFVSSLLRELLRECMPDRNG